MAAAMAEAPAASSAPRSSEPPAHQVMVRNTFINVENPHTLKHETMQRSRSDSQLSSSSASWLDDDEETPVGSFCGPTPPVPAPAPPRQAAPKQTRSTDSRWQNDSAAQRQNSDSQRRQFDSGNSASDSSPWPSDASPNTPIIARTPPPVETTRWGGEPYAPPDPSSNPGSLPSFRYIVPTCGSSDEERLSSRTRPEIENTRWGAQSYTANPAPSWGGFRLDQQQLGASTWAPASGSNPVPYMGNEGVMQSPYDHSVDPVYSTQDSRSQPDQFVDNIPGFSSEDFPSEGSKLHFMGDCKPCTFHPKNRCLRGESCFHCHYDHDLRPRLGKKSRDRGKRKELRALQEALNGSADPFAVM